MVGAAAAGLCHFLEDEIKQMCEMGEKIVVTGEKKSVFFTLVLLESWGHNAWVVLMVGA